MGRYLLFVFLLLVVPAFALDPISTLEVDGAQIVTQVEFQAHDAGDVIERFFVMLLALVGSGTVLWMVMNVLMQMRLYDWFCGDGVDGKPSLLFPKSKADPYVLLLAGWLVAHTMQWNAFAYLHGFTMDAYLANAKYFVAQGYGWMWTYHLGWSFMVFITGVAVAQGPDFLKGMGAKFAETVEAIKKMFGKDA